MTRERERNVGRELLDVNNDYVFELPSICATEILFECLTTTWRQYSVHLESEGAFILTAWTFRSVSESAS